MNRSELEALILGGDEADLTPDIKALIDADPQLKDLYQRTCLTRQLCSLKRYERPDRVREVRMRQDILRRIRQQQDEPGRLSIWEVLTGSTTPALRFGIAALFLALIGIQLFTSPPPPPERAVVEQPAKAVVSAEATPGAEVILLASTNLPADDRLPTPSYPIASVSNVEPGRIQYGPGPSRPVSFDY